MSKCEVCKESFWKLCIVKKGKKNKFVCSGCARKMEKRGWQIIGAQG